MQLYNQDAAQCASASAQVTTQVLASLLLLFLAADLGRQDTGKLRKFGAGGRYREAQ